MSKFVKRKVSELPAECFLEPVARQLSGLVEFRDEHIDLIRQSFRIWTHIFARSHPEKVNINIVLGSPARINLAVCNPNSSFEIGDEASGSWNIVYFRQAHVKIGDRTTSNGVKVFADGGRLNVGADCMMSEDIVMHCGDNHAVIDMKTGKPLNSAPARIEIEDHVWVGAGARIMGGAKIGKGCVVAAGAVVPGKSFEPCKLIAGNPARVRKSNVSWTRDVQGASWDAIRQQYDLKVEDI